MFAYVRRNIMAFCLRHTGKKEICKSAHGNERFTSNALHFRCAQAIVLYGGCYDFFTQMSK